MVYPKLCKVRLGSVQLIELCGLIQMVELVDYSDEEVVRDEIIPRQEYT